MLRVSHMPQHAADQYMLTWAPNKPVHATGILLQAGHAWAENNGGAALTNPGILQICYFTLIENADMMV